MPITRANLEAALVSRCGALWAAIGNPITVVGTNTSLDDVLATSAYEAGLTLADSTTLADADLADVGMAIRSNLLDRSTLRMLRTIRDNWLRTSSTLDMKSQNHSDILKSLDTRIEALQAHIDSHYAPAPTVVGTNSISSGTLRLWTTPATGSDG